MKVSFSCKSEEYNPAGKKSKSGDFGRVARVRLFAVGKTRIALYVCKRRSKLIITTYIVVLRARTQYRQILLVLEILCDEYFFTK